MGSVPQIFPHWPTAFPWPGYKANSLAAYPRQRPLPSRLGTEIEKAETDDLSFEEAQYRVSTSISTSEDLRNAPWILRRHYHPLLERDDIDPRILVVTVRELGTLVAALEREKGEKAAAMFETHKVQLQWEKDRRQHSRAMHQFQKERLEYLGKLNKLEMALGANCASNAGHQIAAGSGRHAEKEKDLRPDPQLGVEKDSTEHRQDHLKNLYSRTTELRDSLKKMITLLEHSQMEVEYWKATQRRQEVRLHSLQRDNDRFRNMDGRLRMELRQAQIDAESARQALQIASNNEGARDGLAQATMFREDLERLRKALERSLEANALVNVEKTFQEKRASDLDGARAVLESERDRLLREKQYFKDRLLAEINKDVDSSSEEEFSTQRHASGEEEIAVRPASEQSSQNNLVWDNESMTLEAYSLLSAFVSETRIEPPYQTSSSLLASINDAVRDSNLESELGYADEPDPTSPNAAHVPASEKESGQKRKRDDDYVASTDERPGSVLGPPKRSTR